MMLAERKSENVAKNSWKKLNVPKPQPAPVEPVDYIYVDRERLAALHTQILGSGTPIESKVTENYKSAEASTQRASLKVVSADMSSSDERTVGTENRFDPAWLSVFETIDELDRRGYIMDKVAGVPVGSLIRIHGFMQMVDLGVMRNLWGPLMKTKTAQDALKNSSDDSNPLFGLVDVAEIAQHMPHPLVVQLIARVAPYGTPVLPDEQTSTNWGILPPQNFIGSAESFSLMNGGFAVGEYEMIAILDVGALPGSEVKIDELFQQQNAFHIMLGLQQQMRKFFGRPDVANGVTPLIISRRLRAHAEVAVTT